MSGNDKLAEHEQLSMAHGTDLKACRFSFHLLVRQHDLVCVPCKTGTIGKGLRAAPLVRRPSRWWRWRQRWWQW